MSGEPARSQRRENISAGQRAKAFPEVCPVQIASEQLREVAEAQVNVNNGNNDRRVSVQDEVGQWQHEPGR